jgi:uncharacterized protein (UPF0332 family)
MDVFQDCLTKGRIKQIEPDVNLAAKELDTAREELQRARAGYVAGRWDEAVTQAYFALHRCARAAIASRGYKDTNLYGLLIALDHLFVETGLLPPTTSRQIRQAKDIKDSVYDSRRATFHEARQVLQWSQDLAKAVFARLALPGFDAAQIDTTLPEPTGSRPPQTSAPSAPSSSSGSRWPRERTEGYPRRDRWAGSPPPREEQPLWKGQGQGQIPAPVDDRTLWHPPARSEPRNGPGGVRRRFRWGESQPPARRVSGDDEEQSGNRRDPNALPRRDAE